jgi:AcrR family transcriptional regulator
MGHREDLLAGAKRCLYTKGYARTTARDIVAASGTNLASIGYHFGSKEALLNAALIDATETWGAELDRALAKDKQPELPPLQRVEATWSRIIELFASHRPLWAANFEILAQIEHAPEVRKFLTEANENARLGLAELFHGIHFEVEPEAAAAVGAFYQALLTGLMAQWLIDPNDAPSGKDMTLALRVILGQVNAAEKPGSGERVGAEAPA